jgi:hypothetical protein
MKTFKYNLIPKIIYRYANIPANLILVFYLLASVLGLSNDWKFIFPLLITIMLLYVLNKFYLKMYKSFPFNIQIDNVKMICSDFVINNRNIVIELSDILKIKGGIFSGRAYMPLYISTDKIKLGISPHIKDYNKLLTIILTNVSKELYESLLDDIKNIAHDSTPQKRTKKTDKNR